MEGFNPSLELSVSRSIEFKSKRLEKGFIYLKLINYIEQPKLLVIGGENLFSKSRPNTMVQYLNELKEPQISFASVTTPQKGKVKKKDFTEELQEILAFCETYGIKTIGVANPDYFKFMTNSKFEINLGEALKGIKELEGYTIVPLMNFNILSRFPNKRGLFIKSVTALNLVHQGTYRFGKFKPKRSDIFTSNEEVIQALKEYLDEPILFLDIETTGLKFDKGKLLTISFAKNQEDTFCIGIHQKYHSEKQEENIRVILKRFFEAYKGKIVFHNTQFDMAFIIHQIFRKGVFDKSHYAIVNKLNLEDTLIMAYLLKNSTERVELGLKNLVYSLYGEYDKDVNQANLIEYPLLEVATYNNLDVSATAYLYYQLKKELEDEGLYGLYLKYLNYMKLIIKFKMNGMVIDKGVVEKAEKELQEIDKEVREKLSRNRYILATEKELNKLASLKYNNTHKSQKDEYQFDVKFNPNSSNHKKILFYDVLGLEVTKLTDTKQPSTDSETLKSFLGLGNPEIKEIVEMLIDISNGSKVLNTYLTPFKSTVTETKQGEFRIFGNFNLTGTITGRLSSNNPNLQNLPSNSTYGKLIKSCFTAPEGFLFCGSDYGALEDRLLANAIGKGSKVDIFLKGIDGHSLNAYKLFKNEFDALGLVIDINDPSSINQIKEHPKGELIRQRSKSVTFALAYGGTKYAIANSIHCSIEEAEVIFNDYNKINHDVLELKQKYCQMAFRDGSIISNFSGLRLKTPNLNSPEASLVSKEQRVIGNFMIQSGGIITIDSMLEFQEWIEKENLIGEVELILTIHDAIYLYIKNDCKLIAKVNKTLIGIMTKDYMENQAVPLTAELDVGTAWNNLVKLPNNANVIEVKESLKVL